MKCVVYEESLKQVNKLFLCDVSFDQKVSQTIFLVDNGLGWFSACQLDREVDPISPYAF